MPAGLLLVKAIAAGGSHNLVSPFSNWLNYPVDASRDLLLIYNTGSTASAWVKDYYLAHRPMATGANVLGVGCPVGEFMGTNEFVTQLQQPLLSWLNANPSKHPNYFILFLDMPSRLTNGAYPDIYGSVSFALREHTPGIKPFITHINMNGTSDCKGYIDKLEYIGTNYSPAKILLSASAGGYGNTNYVLDGIRHGTGYSCAPPCGECDYSADGAVVGSATNGLLAAGVPQSAILFSDGIETCGAMNGCTCTDPHDLPHPTGTPNLAGYICWGIHSSLAPDYQLYKVAWAGNSRWWIIETIESFNGQRVTWMGNFIRWFGPNAFGGTNYSNTPVGAVTHVEEPRLSGVNDASTYFGLWARGKNFGISAWQSRWPTFYYFQAVGDPLVVR